MNENVLIVLSGILGVFGGIVLAWILELREKRDD